NAGGADRAPHILNISVPGVANETLLLTLDLEGIAASSGSACSSGSVKPSHVLLALGHPPEIAAPSVRFSLGRGSAVAEIDRGANAFPGMVERLRSLAAL